MAATDLGIVFGFLILSSVDLVDHYASPVSIGNSCLLYYLALLHSVAMQSGFMAVMGEAVLWDLSG